MNNHSLPKSPRVSTALLPLAAGLLVATSAFAAPIVNIDFEAPEYTIGDSYDAATNTGNLTGSLPNELTLMTAGAGSAWTADIMSGGGGQVLHFFIPINSTNPSSSFGASTASNPGGDSGTWFVSFDYTRLSGGGALSFDWGAVNTSGQFMKPQANGQFYVDTLLAPTSNFAVGVSTNLRMEIDMGDPTSTTDGRLYVNDTLYLTFDAMNNSGGAQFGGFQMNFFSSQAADREFSIDNIIVDQVIPEPSTAMFLAAGIGGLLFRARRRRS